jgi:hypothetical protein
MGTDQRDYCMAKEKVKGHEDKERKINRIFSSSRKVMALFLLPIPNTGVLMNKACFRQYRGLWHIKF